MTARKGETHEEFLARLREASAMRTPEERAHRRATNRQWARKNRERLNAQKRVANMTPEQLTRTHEKKVAPATQNSEQKTGNASTLRTAWPTRPPNK